MLICVGIRAHVAKNVLFLVVTIQHTHMSNTCLYSIEALANSKHRHFLLL